MTETSMVERVARAICEKEEPDGLGNWEAYIAHSKAAIEAITMTRNADADQRLKAIILSVCEKLDDDRDFGMGMT